MPKTNWIPGPYQVVHRNNGPYIVAKAPEGIDANGANGMVNVGSPTHVPGCAVETDVANMQIMAAGPELYDAVTMALEWIDALPKDLALPPMPGFDRDWVEGVLAKARGGNVD